MHSSASNAWWSICFVTGNNLYAWARSRRLAYRPIYQPAAIDWWLQSVSADAVKWSVFCLFCRVDLVQERQLFIPRSTEISKCSDSKDLIYQKSFNIIIRYYKPNWHWSSLWWTCLLYLVKRRRIWVSGFPVACKHATNTNAIFTVVQNKNVLTFLIKIK